MVIKLGLDDADFGKGVTNAKKQVNYLAKEMQSNLKVADLAGSKMGALGTKYEGLTKIIGAQERQVTELKKAYEGSFVDGKATESTKRLASQLQDANGKLAAHKQQLIDTAGEIAEYKIRNEGLTGAINKTSESLVKSGSAMQTAGSALTKGLTVPLAAGVTAVTAAAISWESSFAGVKKTVDEVTDSNGKVTYSYAQLEDELRGLAKTLPSTHGEIASVAEAAGQLGIQSEKVVSFTKTMIDLGESTNMSAESAATGLARFANITQMSQDDFGRLGSVLVDLGNNFATTEQEIMDMGLRLAGAGKQIGMSEAEIMSMAAALSSVGIEAEAGGSAFSKVMVNMQLATETGAGAFDELERIANNAGITLGELGQSVVNGGKELKAMGEKVGIPAKALSQMYKEADKAAISLESFSDVAGLTNLEFAELFKNDPSKAIMKFVEGLSKAEEQGTSAIKVLDDMDITEVRLRDSLLRAANASGVFEEAIAMGTKAWEENTALTEEAGKRYETTESKLKMLKNEAVDVAIEMGGPFVDALRDGLQAAKPLIEKLAEMAKAFSDADPKTQQMIVGLVGFGAAAGPLLSLTGGLTKGIGKLGGSFVDLLAKMAKKTAVTEMTIALAEGAISAGEFGGAASLAGGAKGIGGLVSAIGLSMPVVLGLVGAGGALAVGYGAWKLFGEEAWNSAQRVKNWGYDVGETTGKALTDIQTNTQSASGELNLMAQGFDTNTESMVENFEKIGLTIQNQLTEQINAFRESLDLLPEEVRGAAEEIIEAGISEREEALKIVEENNQRIVDIKKKYVDKEGKVTIQGAKMIQDLMKQSTQEYLKITVEDADARRQIMDALTGDVESASKEQAEAWLQSLGKQRQTTKETYTQQLEDYKSYLDDKGILNTEEGKQLVELFEKARDQSTDAIDAQMAIIAEKYPELADKIFLANGQLISSMGEAGDAAKKANQDIIENAQNLSNKLAANAKKNAEILAWTADESTEAGRIWNSLELIDKEGNVKSNASEIVKEAAKDTRTWNEMRMLVHEANIDSNAKKVIGEAAIANGWWEGMAWADKEAVLQDEFSIATYKALESSGKWAELSFEEKKAILYSNTPDVIQSTLQDLGLWEALDPSVKQLIGINTSVVQALQGGEVALNNYDANNPDTKQLLGNAFPVVNSAREGEGALNSYAGNNPAQKDLLGNPYPVVQATNQGGSALNTYASNNPATKNLNANDNASGPAKNATGAVQEFGRQGNKTVELVTKVKTIFQEFKEKYFAKGTNYHTGGPAVVNDQRGSLYRELIELPSGQMFIPEERNVRLNLPRGSKVYTASQTKQMIPHYAEGVGVPSNATIVNNLRAVGDTKMQTTDFSELTKLMRDMLNAISRLTPEINIYEANLGNKHDIRRINEELAFLTQIEKGGVS